MKKLKYNLLVMLALLTVTVPMMTSCSDEPDSENYYTFKGEMMSTYLTSRPQYSQFAEIVSRAGLMNLLSSYGQFTCFAPTNEAVSLFLQEEGYSSVDQLTKADCDTIARTHLLSVLYSTYDMADGVLTQPNMNNRYLEVSRKLDQDSNSVVYLNDAAHIYFELQDDSVENGIVQPIDRVLKSSNRMLPDVIAENPKVSIFSEALKLTGLRSQLFTYKDESYTQPVEDDGLPTWHYYETGGSLSDPIKEYARAPKERLVGFTAFIVPDSVLKARYGIDKDSEDAMQKLYNLACQYYPEETEGAGLENASNPANPLYKFMAYHILNRNAHGYNLLTVLEDIGIDVNKMNPTEWFGTLLPYSLMKVEKLTMRKYQGSSGIINDRYINRRVDDRYNISGSHIVDHSKASDGYRHEAMNGIYFYIDDIAVFDNTMKEDVMNCRMRMDMSAVFPELMTNSIRMNYKGNGLWEAANDQRAASKDERWGTNYYFPDGYLDGVTIGNNGYLCYRRPRYTFWSYSGDEFVCNGNFDVTIRIPPVPVKGDYQIRLGYAAMSVRGIAQIYFDGKPQGIPLDMRRDMNNDALLGSDYWGKHDDEYNKDVSNGGMTEEEKLEERKELKNKGFYRGANGAYRKGSASDAGQHFAEIYATIRIVLCTTYIEPGTDHYLRFRCVSEGLGNNEIMLDYIEIVPKSVYGVVDEGVQEDDL